MFFKQLTSKFPSVQVFPQQTMVWLGWVGVLVKFGKSYWIASHTPPSCFLSVCRTIIVWCSPLYHLADYKIKAYPTKLNIVFHAKKKYIDIDIKIWQVRHQQGQLSYMNNFRYSTHYLIVVLINICLWIPSSPPKNKDFPHPSQKYLTIHFF